MLQGAKDLESYVNAVLVNNKVKCKCKSSKISLRPQKAHQGEQLIHRRYIKSSPQ